MMVKGVDESRKIIYFTKDVYRSMDGCSLRDLSDLVEDLIAECGEKATLSIDAYNYTDYTELEVLVSGTRLETNEEMNKRIKNEREIYEKTKERDKERRKKTKENELKELKRLVKKYGVPGNS